MAQANPITKDDLTESLQPIFERFDAIDKRLDNIETDIREIKSDISRIDANIDIMATSQGYPYSKEERVVRGFERKVR